MLDSHRRAGKCQQLLRATEEIKADRSVFPETWSSRHFGHIEGVNPIFLRRTAALRLVQMVAGGSLAEAASLLGIADPDRTWQGRTYSGAGHVHSHAKDQPDPRGFENGLRTLAAELDTSAHLVDYQDRRQRLCDWSLDPMAWQELITRLPPTPGPVQPELGDRKRQCASIYVWVRLTLKGGIYH